MAAMRTVFFAEVVGPASSRASVASLAGRSAFSRAVLGDNSPSRGLIVRHSLCARLSVLSSELCFGLNPSLLFVKFARQDHLPFAELILLMLKLYAQAIARRRTFRAINAMGAKKSLATHRRTMTLGSSAAYRGIPPQVRFAPDGQSRTRSSRPAIEENVIPTGSDTQ